MSNLLRTIILLFVTAVWGVNFTAPIIIRDYKPPDAINIAFMGTVGVLLSTYRKGESNSDDADDNDDTKKVKPTSTDAILSEKDKEKP